MKIIYIYIYLSSRILLSQMTASFPPVLGDCHSLTVMLTNVPSTGSIILFHFSIQPETFIESVGILHSCCIGPSPIFAHNGPSDSKASGEQRDAGNACTHPLTHPYLQDHIALVSWGNQTEVDNHLIVCLQ